MKTISTKVESGLSEKLRNYIPSQKFIGMQVVDSKGAIVGSVKDFAISITDKEVLLIVDTKVSGDIEVPLANVSSIEDVVLLAKPEDAVVGSPPPSPLPPSTITCKTCGTTLPSRAKFCAKCGSQVK
jgi:sporulation protein YlmC with PRC-barrel domain